VKLKSYAFPISPSPYYPRDPRSIRAIALSNSYKITKRELAEQISVVKILL